jgi:ribulose-phosphate 3-epimerase
LGAEIPVFKLNKQLKMKHLVAPSVLSADFSVLGQEIEMVNQSEADWFHVDIMDGMFVPNISFGFPIVRTIKKYAQKPLDVHLMIVDPDRYLEEFRNAGADILTVHYEACPHLHRTVQKIKSLGMKAGVALNPHTPISQLEEILEDLDMVLLMTVNPGFGAQKFIERSYNKVSALREIINQNMLSTLIEVDGGVDTKNWEALVNAGVDVLVAGNTVFNSPDKFAAIKTLKGL